MMQKTLLTFCFLILSFVAFSQANKDLERKYESGKQLLKQEKYDLAREIFSSLSKQTADNPYIAYSHYYQAYALFKTAKYDAARLQLIQLLEKYPSFSDAESANYLLANIAFEKGNEDAALGYLEKCKSKQIREDVQNLKSHYLAQEQELNTLKNLQKKYPEDEVIAGVLIDKLLASARDEDASLAKQLDTKFKLGRIKAMEELKKISKKAEYNIAVLFPFQPEGMEAGKPRNNQFVLDMYEGIRIAADELTTQGTKVNVFAYDIANDGNKMLETVNLPEFAGMDILIGPLYGATNKVAVAFANQKSVGLINPISNNGQLIENNPSAYLLKPSLETQVQKAAEYALNTFAPKSVMILFGPTPKDSSLAVTYRKQILDKGGKVNAIKKITQVNVGDIAQAITETQETSLGHVFITTDNQNIVVNFTNALEQRSSKVPVVTLSNWLELKLISFDQFERRNIHFIYPEYIDYGSETVKSFRKNYVSKKSIIPSIYSYQGYDMMLFFGRLLGEHGTFFHQALHQQAPQKGVILPGYNYTGANDNQYVPLVKFQNAQLVLINPIAE
ncbi:ABC transporter substrate-binding protein [Rhodocytophaga rosea]|uniref:ABC transporter substrate-binding protein n=1 Tax=Rhodocytophaga rosea TaxID=2704465 RepID=A0A6C0GHI1_9BACT|nr:ABC transporter substrate-binding protein [Rhodocytophaga rosea]QHT67142.1 ABC transporter substrate-binding protein [Rhodocytophaga rosea]